MVIPGVFCAVVELSCDLVSKRYAIVNLELIPV